MHFQCIICVSSSSMFSYYTLYLLSFTITLQMIKTMGTIVSYNKAVVKFLFDKN